jgi:hypothetical protein
MNIDDRKEGFWNRSILAGVRTIEISIALIAIAMILAVVIMFLISIALHLSGAVSKGSLLLLAVFYLLFCWCGAILGLCLAAFCQSQMFSKMVLLGCSCCSTFIIGEFEYFAIRLLKFLIIFRLYVAA